MVALGRRSNAARLLRLFHGLKYSRVLEETTTSAEVSLCLTNPISLPYKSHLAPLQIVQPLQVGSIVEVASGSLTSTRYTIKTAFHEMDVLRTIRLPAKRAPKQPSIVTLDDEEAELVVRVYCTQRRSSSTGQDRRGNCFNVINVTMLNDSEKKALTKEKALKRWNKAWRSGTIVLDLVKYDGCHYAIWLFSEEQDDKGDHYNTDQLFSSDEESRRKRAT